MAEVTARDTKLIQYLNEANSKEKELEAALQAHIAMTTLADRKPYKKRLQQHLKETKAHSKSLERRIKKLGGPSAVEGLVSTGAKVVAGAKGQSASALKGPLHALRGTSDQEKLLKNAKSEYFNEHEEIATYTAIETLADAVGDAETAKLARDIRKEEERMAKYLEKLIPQLTKAVVKEEIPASERRKPAARRRSPSARKPATARKSSTGGRKSSSARKPAASSRRRS